MFSNIFLDRLHSTVKDTPPRGGSSISEVNGKIIIFGGADREQCHFQDILVYSESSTAVDISKGNIETAGAVFTRIIASGDVPTPRSGHAVAAYGKYMFLFGGIDFHEQAAYNDLYMLDTSTYCWYYVGESGCEVSRRNSHSLAILTCSMQKRCLVIFGGASPDKGPLGDTVYAALPSHPEEISDPSAFFVKWNMLESGGPSSREMHGSCCSRNALLVVGGRNEEGATLSDVWMLTLASSESSISLLWTQRRDLELPAPCCAMGAAIIEIPVIPLPSTDSSCTPSPLPVQLKAQALEKDTSALVSATVQPPAPPMAPLTAAAEPSAPPLQQSSSAAATTNDTPIDDIMGGSVALDASLIQYLFIVGGFTGTQILEDVRAIEIRTGLSDRDNYCSSSSVSGSGEIVVCWSQLPLQRCFGGRFGLTLCSVSQALAEQMCRNQKYAPLLSSQLKESVLSLSTTSLHCKGHHSAMILFGGVDAQRDYGDIWLFAPSRVGVTSADADTKA